MAPPVYVALVVGYVLLMLGVGYLSMRRTRDIHDFFIGGRTFGPWVSAFAYGTTYFSAVLFIGYAGKLGWGFGIYTLWIVLGNTLVGTLLAWRLLAARTREMTVRLGAITLPEFLRARYDSRPLQLLASVVVFVFLVPYSASVLMGLSYLFEMTLHIRYETALYFLTALTAVYLVMGGYFAVAVSDFIRGIVEFGGVMVMVFLLAHRPEVGGFLRATQSLLADPRVNAPGLFATKAVGKGLLAVAIPGWLTLFALVLVTSFGPWALPQMVQKFYAIRSRRDVTRALTIAGLFSLFMAFGAYFSGALTHLYYGPKLPRELLGPGGPIWDKIMPHFITTSGLPEALVLVIVLMVFSASMSSLSSLVLVSSSAVAIDLYGALRGGRRGGVGLLRALCALFVGFSLVIALAKPAVIVNLMVMSWGALSGVFLAPYLYGLFVKRTTRAGVYAGMASGLACAFVLFPAWGPDGVPLAGALAMSVPLLVVPLVSLFTRAPQPSLVAAAFGEVASPPPEPLAASTVRASNR
ncbi:MAG TPA: sodium:solute symporter family protein [Anaeromyxobacteraceae bacterium]|nr:sodium:solute symporter family protein [Anaeromyxobacteraceae bacterium]